MKEEDLSELQIISGCISGLAESATNDFLKSNLSIIEERLKNVIASVSSTMDRHAKDAIK